MEKFIRDRTVVCFWGKSVLGEVFSCRSFVPHVVFYHVFSSVLAPWSVRNAVSFLRDEYLNLRLGGGHENDHKMAYP